MRTKLEPNAFSLRSRKKPNPQSPDPDMASGSHGLIRMDSVTSLLKPP